MEVSLKSESSSVKQVVRVVEEETNTDLDSN